MRCFAAAALCAGVAAWSPIEAPCAAGLTPAPGALRGHAALVISTSHGKLGPANCTSCKPTGVFAEEMTAPYFLFRDAGMNTTLASIAGGPIPIDPTYNESLMQSSWDKRFYRDPEALRASRSTPPVAALDFSAFDIIFMAGGWGAAWDLGTSDALARGVTAAYANPKQFLGSVCHGALGFIKAVKPNGEGLCKGTRMTGVTDRQIEELGIAKLTPMHPEDELKKAGAVYECKHGVLGDLLENDVVADGNVVTGQNQMGACMVPQQLMQMLIKSRGL